MTQAAKAKYQEAQERYLDAQRNFLTMQAEYIAAQTEYLQSQQLEVSNKTEHYCHGTTSSPKQCCYCGDYSGNTCEYCQKHT